jgi:hypothetical protein
VNKTVYLLNISDYAPELTAITYPTIDRYAERIGADVHVITERLFPDWPITYEKLQIHELARARGDDWSIYFDSDCMIHPELVDVTELAGEDTVLHNANDWAPVRFDQDEYFRRDGRGIGSCNWFACASSWCRDLWRPLDIGPAAAVAAIHPTMQEKAVGIEAEHLVDDYALSRNIARYGLKFQTLRKLWEINGLVLPDFFFHEYLHPLEDWTETIAPDNEIVHKGKITMARETAARWGLG